MVHKLIDLKKRFRLSRKEDINKAIQKVLRNRIRVDAAGFVAYTSEPCIYFQWNTTEGVFESETIAVRKMNRELWHLYWWVNGLREGFAFFWNEKVLS
jgi:hypothetical protein